MVASVPNTTAVSPDQLYGELFHAVQIQRIFPDSKTFTDCFPVETPEEIVQLYQLEKEREGFSLAEFVHAHFTLPTPPFSEYISDTSQSTANNLHILWDTLIRFSEPNGSMLPLPNPYIVPGGRFRDMYYWDTYFTMLGLKQSGKVELIRYMVENCAFLIDTYGHIPNGNRSYYLSRSQPPFFSLMVRLLAEIDGPDTLVYYLSSLQKEYDFWMDGSRQLESTCCSYRRAVRMPDGTMLNRYWDDNPTPRPESYREDVELAHEAQQLGAEPEAIYRHVRAACESGWDFSSRWLADGKSMTTIHTTDIVPVDLNVMLHELEMILAEAYSLQNNPDCEGIYRQKAQIRREAINRFFWNEEKGFFFDYDWVTGQQTEAYTLAAAFPLFLSLASPEQAQQVSDQLLTHFLQPGGLMTTLTISGQQWDDPNGWAPLQWVGYKALKNYGFDEGAHKVKAYWLLLNDQVFERTGQMMEKYNVTNTSLKAGGGEYPTQDGFGWTNGVYLQLLAEK